MFLFDNGRIRISVGFCLLLAWFLQANGAELLLMMLGAAAVHELGHCVVLSWLGGHIRNLQLSVFGALMETDSRCLSYAGEAAAVLAGPFANFLGAVFFSLADTSLCRVFTGANLALCLFNLLPIRPLDGGRALELGVSLLWGTRAGECAARIVGACFALGLGMTLVWLVVDTGGSLWLLPAIAGMGIAAWRECLGK